MIIYLNTDWRISDGGDLCVYQASDLQKREPKIGTGVFFKSDEPEHEVLPTPQPIMSNTGWLKVERVPVYNRPI